MLAACGGGERSRPEPVPVVAVDWRAVATAADRDRLRNWRGAWSAALPRVTPAQTRTYGPLLEPDRAQAGPLPPIGDYRCRTIKLGARSPGMLDFIAYPWFTCRVSAGAGALSFAKIDGSQRPVGAIYDDGPSRGVFLGTLALGDERSAMRYGQDRSRDMAGIVERVGERRWRIVLPYPAFESLLDVLELVPA